MIFPVVLLCAVVLCGCLCGCDAREMTSLPDISKPYAGTYECTELTLGGEDALGRFDYVRLELKGDETFALSYRTAEGNEGGVDGEYKMDLERGEVTLSKKTLLRTVSYVFAVEKGEIFGEMNMSGELLHARFAMP